MIRIGTNPIAWSNDDDRRLGADIPLQRCLRDAAEIGFDGIEKGHKMPDTPAELRAALAPHGLALVSAWHSLTVLDGDLTTERQRLGAHLTLLRELGCEVCIVCETSGAVHADDTQALSSRPLLSADRWTAFGAALETLAGDCLEAGTRLVYHHHMGTVVQTRAEIDRLMAVTGPHTQLLVDTGHAQFAGVDPVALARTHGARIGHWHLKNVRAEVAAKALREDWSFLTAVRAGVFTVPGDAEGAVEFPALLAAASASDYAGWLVVEAEQDPAHRPPLDYQRLGYQTLTSLAAQAGFERAARP